jgi:flagellar protein FlaJ
MAMAFNTLETYKKFCYTLGFHIDKRPNDAIARLIYQSDLELTPGLFISIWVVTTAISVVLALIIFSILFLTPFSPFAGPSGVLYIIVLTVLSGAAAGIGFPFYLQNQITNKRMDIERQLPYAFAFMSILASSGTTPLEIIRRIAYEDYGHVSKEFQKVVFRVDILGEDVVTSMNVLVANTPSKLFRDICIDLTNIIYSGGGMKDYLEAKSKEMMGMRRLVYKEFVDSLSVFGEMYLGGIVMLIIFASLGVILSGALGIELGPFKPKEMFSYLVYLIVPLVNIVFLQILSVKYSTNP